MRRRERKEKCENYFVHCQNRRFICEKLLDRFESDPIQNDEEGGSKKK